MPLWKWLLLHVYYNGSQPARWWIRRKLAAQRRLPIAVLYYHRIADDAAMECTMPNQTFIDQMCWLRQNFEMISMEEVQRRLRSGVNDRPAVHVTFDDGYADNCQTAIPWLVKERIPCTYFVTVQNILECRPFDHDLKLRRESDAELARGDPGDGRRRHRDRDPYLQPSRPRQTDRCRPAASRVGRSPR